MDQPVGTTRDPNALPTFEDYIRDQKIVREIESIHRFNFTLTYQKSGAISSQAAQEALASQGYAVLNDLLEQTGIHHLDALSASPIRKPGTSDGTDDSKPLFEFRFTHDPHHCNFQFFEDRFAIERPSSSLKDFYDWYCNVMPAALRIEMTLRQIVHRATNRILRPVRSSHAFIFDFCEFWKQGKGDVREEGRNMDVLEEIIPRLPDNHQMVDLTHQEFHRLDLTVSKQEQIGNVSRNVWYQVEAPFNKGGRFIVFGAELRNNATERIEDGVVVRTDAFDPDIGAEYRLALVDFLRDRALEGFAAQLLGNWNFSTERFI